MTNPAYGNGNHAQTAIVSSDEVTLQNGIEWAYYDIKGLISLAENSINKKRLRLLREVEKLLSELNKGA